MKRKKRKNIMKKKRKIVVWEVYLMMEEDAVMGVEVI
jgi:hypothetical protein